MLSKQRELQMEKDEQDQVVMSLKTILAICRIEAHYEFPELNNKLYLHFKGFRNIQSLQPFINLKTLYLENNLIQKIQNLGCLVNLQNLYLQSNLIKKIENLDNLTELVTLNLSQNKITQIENLEKLVKLNNLTISTNCLLNYESLEGLLNTAKLSNLDLSSNNIQYDANILEQIFAEMPQLRVPYLFDNPIVREVQFYRKTIISLCPKMTYLGDRPVFPDERRLCNAFRVGGDEGYQEEKQKMAEEIQLSKRRDSQERKIKIEESYQKRLQYFEQSIKKSYLEVQVLEKKLNRAKALGDEYLQIGIMQQIEDQRNSIIEADKIMRELKKQIEACNARQLENSVKIQQMENQVAVLAPEKVVQLFNETEARTVLEGLVVSGKTANEIQTEFRVLQTDLLNKYNKPSLIQYNDEKLDFLILETIENYNQDQLNIEESASVKSASSTTDDSSQNNLDQLD